VSLARAEQEFALEGGSWLHAAIQVNTKIKPSQTHRFIEFLQRLLK
jgi:hypothetical protein